jgi:uncharacterized protein (DUF362 family)
MDAYAPMLRFGPRGLPKNDDTIFYAKTLLASTDIVAIDAAAARILGHAEDGIPHVKIASDSGFGTCKLSTVKIERVVLS